MTRTAIAAAMLAAAMGSAFAGTDYFVPQNINRTAPANPPPANVDSGATMSISHDMPKHAKTDKMTTGSDPAQAAPDLGLSIWTQ
jgi:hypothetical protein